MPNGPSSGVLASQQVRRLEELASELTSQVPDSPPPGSPRSREEAALSGSPARIRLLRDLNVDSNLFIGGIRLVASGVADCLEIAEGRGNMINGSALAITVRPLLEAAGLIAWVLADDIDERERCRRYLAWLFADLKRQRELVATFSPQNADAAEEVTELEREEARLTAKAKDAGFEVDASDLAAKQPVYSTVMGDAGKRLRPPILEDLVRLVSSTKSVYALLSSSVHISLYALKHALEIDGTTDDGVPTGKLTAFGPSANSLIGLTALAVDRACRQLAGWNGLATDELHAQCLALVSDVGM